MSSGDSVPRNVSGNWWRDLCAGAVAGLVSRTCTAPLDRAKIFFQVHGTRKTCFGTCFQNFVNEGGPFSLWRGNGVNVLKVAPETGIKFMIYEKSKDIMRLNSNRTELSITEKFAAGAIAGALSQSAIYPLEVLKTRLALRRTGEYKGILDSIIKIYKNQGVRAFWRGYVPNICGAIPFAGIDLAVYETLKKLYIGKYCEKEQIPNPVVLLGCGAVSSSFGQICTYPLALVRTKLQASVQNQCRMSSLLKHIVQTEGVTGLYRGLTVNLLKVTPAVGISYIVYEHMKKLLTANL